MTSARVNIVVITIAQAFPLGSSFSANFRKILKATVIKPKTKKRRKYPLFNLPLY